MTNGEMLKKQLEKKDNIEAAAIMVNTCRLFSECGSCDVCMANIERWLNQETGGKNDIRQSK